MSDPTACRGKDREGNQCICLRCEKTVVEEDGRVLCLSCRHIESAHPEPARSAGSLIRGYRDAGRLLLGSVKSSKEEAEAETSSGLRKKRKSTDTDTEPSLKKVKLDNGKGKGKEKEEKPPKGNASSNSKDIVEYGKLVLLPGGIIDGVLQHTRVPGATLQDELCEAGLIVLRTPKNLLKMNQNWNYTRVTKELKVLCEKPMTYLERKTRETGGDEAHCWRAVVRDGKNLALSGNESPGGIQLALLCKAVSGKAKADRVLYLASQLPISARRYNNWDATDSEPESDDDHVGTDLETPTSEDIIMTPRKKTARKIKVKLEPELSEDEEETDMKKAAKMRHRTRSATGAKKITPTVFIPGSSDDETRPIPEAGASGSANDAVVISDDEFPSPLALVQTMRPPSAIASAWIPPLIITRPKSPSPAPSPPAPSPSAEPIPASYFDNFDFGLSSVDSPTGYMSTMDFTGMSSPGASTSSGMQSTYFPTSTYSGPTQLPTPTNAVASSSRLPETNAEGAEGSTSQPRFKRMGRGRQGRNPWADTKST
ncbi:hypothetical protein B0H16DRAFT_1761115 [Mycena metata]|uniref:Uncharacterized protein n=1 Tax=Mycena metata TaxID=1033252 RepID=A0AAD7MYP4_9AGAR|nr:hypothetical protein B0H16DRAFT_1761115 [Mycena metata]